MLVHSEASRAADKSSADLSSGAPGGRKLRTEMPLEVAGGDKGEAPTIIAPRMPAQRKPVAPPPVPVTMRPAASNPSNNQARCGAVLSDAPVHRPVCTPTSHSTWQGSVTRPSRPPRPRLYMLWVQCHWGEHTSMTPKIITLGTAVYHSCSRAELCPLVLPKSLQK